jgi:hypothetical protein
VQKLAPGMPTVYLTAQLPTLDNLGIQSGQASAWTAGFQYAQYGSVPRMIQAAGGTHWSSFWRELDAQKVREAQSLGLKVLAWTVNDRETMGQMLDLGVDGLVTDRPDIAIDLLDTAGLEEVLGNGPRAIAQERTWEVLGKADLVILCLSVESPIDALGLDSHSIASLAKCSRLWGVWTKSDLQPDWKSPWPVPVERIFTLSVQDRIGLAPLQEALAQTVAAWQQSSLDVVPMTGVRCESALARAAQSLRYARQTSVDRAGDELVAGELRLALEELGQVAGTVANNDVLDALFSRFCIGK